MSDRVPLRVEELSGVQSGSSGPVYKLRRLLTLPLRHKMPSQTWKRPFPYLEWAPGSSWLGYSRMACSCIEWSSGTSLNGREEHRINVTSLQSVNGPSIAIRKCPPLTVVSSEPAY